MNKLRPHIIFLLLVLFTSTGTISAQSKKFKTSVSKDLVAVGERFKYIIHIENLKGNISPPAFEGFKIVGGPMTQRSTINGHPSTDFTFFLVATQVGTLTIQPATLTTTTGSKKSNKVTIKVVEGKEEVITNSKQRNIGRNEDKNLFARIYLSKTKVYKGEQITATYVIYNRYDYRQFKNYEFPPADGFWKEDVNLGEIKFSDKLEKINGIDYQKAVLEKQILVTQKTGKLKLGPFKFDAIISAGFFRNKSIPITSNIASVEVLPLPSPPSDFHGAIGNLDITVSVDQTEVNANDAINYKVEYSGSGNLKFISAPKIKFDSDFEVYDPKLDDQISNSGSGMRGSRSYEYLIIPRYAGEYTLDPLSFTYFDPKVGRYNTIVTDTTHIHVAGGESSIGDHSNRRKNDVQLLENEIRYIRTDTDLKERNHFFTGSTIHVALFSLPLLLLLGLYFWKRKEYLESKDITGTKIRKAGRKALKEINKAEISLQKGEKESFYESVFDAMYNYLSEKLSIPNANLTKEKISTELAHRNIDSSIITSLMDVLNNCEMARYAPRSKTDDERMLQNADNIIHHLEKNLS